VIGTLAFRHLLVRKVRSAVLLLGFALGVAVMVVLLSVGEAMLDQSRDVSLVGGGELTVRPQGIDVEAMRTGGLSGMFFTIERARFLTRQVLGGPREAGTVRTVAPALEGKLLYLCPARGRCEPTAVRAGGEIPSRAEAVGAGLRVVAGWWHDTPGDSAYVAPTPQQLYDELDAFHLPLRADSTWGEWQYYNLVTGPGEWWYITYLVGGAMSRTTFPGGRWGGRLLVTHRRPDGRHERFTADYPATRVRLDTAAADLTIGGSTVRQRDGVYHLRARAAGASGPVRLDLTVRPRLNRYFPPVELREDRFLSGYVVPALAADASGRICVAGRCTEVRNAPAYHDHNWGIWRAVTWEWGAATGKQLSLLYGGVYASDSTASPFFLALVDSLGVRRVLRFRRIDYQGAQPADGARGASAPTRFTLQGAWEADTVTLRVRVAHALATDMSAGAFRRTFLQMRGAFDLAGRVAGAPVADQGEGFFETYLTR
jgi:hypothetical protein